MSSAAVEYRRRMAKQARAAVDIKWIRNVLAALVAGILLGIYRAGKLEMPTTLGFLENAVLTVTFIAAWEGARYIHQRFWIAPFTESQKQSEKIKLLEGPQNTQALRKLLAAELSVRSEFAVHNLWAMHPDGSDESRVDAWIAAIEQWHEETLRLMKRGGCTQPEISPVRVLGNISKYGPAGGGRYSLHGRVEKYMRMLEGYRQELEKVITKYDNS